MAMSDNKNLEIAVPTPRVKKLIIKNFRGIGATPVEIELDDIVVLVGPNNVGKTSILKAYELVMAEGSNKGKLTLDDFPNRVVDENNLPEIELHTVVYDNAPGVKWITNTEEGEMIVKEKWTWSNVGDKCKRQGFDVENNSWSDNVPWGAANIAKSNRPEPHFIDAFASPDEQAEEIQKLLMKFLEEKISAFKDESTDNEYHQLVEKYREFQKKIVSETEEEINKMEELLNKDIEKVFPNNKVKVETHPEESGDKDIKFFSNKPQLMMGNKEGILTNLNRQGSGARRTLLWAAIKYIAEMNRKKNNKNLERPNVLLLDEPEICLHPNAVRESCKVLYDLPINTNWQVMITTHSPVFIDLSRDNTTIIRVERLDGGEIRGTTLFRPSKVNLSDDDKENLKLLNIYDPYVAEFFFGGKIIIVEGDTEYTAFKYIISQNIGVYSNVHIIRARGKATIASLCKILNQFGSSYAVLHDSDCPTIIKNYKNAPKETVNPAWSNNKKILDSISARPEGTQVRLLASILNFEGAYLSKEVRTEKPYNALESLRTNSDEYEIVKHLLESLIDFEKEVPENCVEWNDVEQLKLEWEKHFE